MNCSETPNSTDKWGIKGATMNAWKKIIKLRAANSRTSCSRSPSTVMVSSRAGMYLVTFIAFIWHVGASSRAGSLFRLNLLRREIPCLHGQGGITFVDAFRSGLYGSRRWQNYRLAGLPIYRQRDLMSIDNLEPLKKADQLIDVPAELHRLVNNLPNPPPPIHTKHTPHPP